MSSLLPNFEEGDFFYDEDKMNALAEKLDYTIRQSSDDFIFETENNLEIKDGISDDDELMSFRCENNKRMQHLEILRLGMTVTTGHVVIKKDASNLIGISIGGGSPYCPCIYIVQVFDGTPAAKDGTLQSGDELLSINKVAVKGKTKVEVAKMIQATSEEVTIHYNKLHAGRCQGETLDIALKKMKHRLVDSMSSGTADSLGLSRAILCNDSLVKRLQELQATEAMYRGLVENAKRMLKAYFDLFQSFQSFGKVYSEISVREPQARASEAFRLFAEMHRNIERDGIKMIKAVKPVLNDLGTYLHKAIPDTKLTIKKYADAKFAYLSYCLKVKEMDDEEHSYAALQEPLYRVETGNYEYRLILRCRQEARLRFARLRSDVLEKMELLESKHARDLIGQLKRCLEGLSAFSHQMMTHLEANSCLFPVEVDLKDNAFQYKSRPMPQYEEDSIDIETALEAYDSAVKCEDLLCSNVVESHKDGTKEELNVSSADELLIELGLSGIDLSTPATKLLDKDDLLK